MVWFLSEAVVAFVTSDFQRHGHDIESSQLCAYSHQIAEEVPHTGTDHHPEQNSHEAATSNRMNSELNSWSLQFWWCNATL